LFYNLLCMVIISNTFSLDALISFLNLLGSKSSMCRHFKTHSVAFEFCKNLSNMNKSSRILNFIRCHSMWLSVSLRVLFKLRFKLLLYFGIDIVFNHGLKYLVSTGSCLSFFSLSSSSFLTFKLDLCSIFCLLFKWAYIISFCKFIAFCINRP